jgi:hypothetical protein
LHASGAHVQPRWYGTVLAVMVTGMTSAGHPSAFNAVSSCRPASCSRDVCLCATFRLSTLLGRTGPARPVPSSLPSMCRALRTSLMRQCALWKPVGGSMLPLLLQQHMLLRLGHCGVKCVERFTWCRQCRQRRRPRQCRWWCTRQRRTHVIGGVGRAGGAVGAHGGWGSSSIWYQNNQ